MTHPHVTHHFPVVGVVRLLNEREAVLTQAPLDLHHLCKLKRPRSMYIRISKQRIGDVETYYN